MGQSAAPTTRASAFGSISSKRLNLEKQIEQRRLQRKLLNKAEKLTRDKF